MTTFDTREHAFESGFAHDEEMMFKATARRDKLLGLWAAEKMGLTGETAASYAKEVIFADLKEVGEDDVVAKVKSDFAAKGVDISDAELRGRMAQLLAEAKQQILTEK